MVDKMNAINLHCKTLCNYKICPNILKYCKDLKSFLIEFDLFINLDLKAEFPVNLSVLKLIAII